MKNELAHYGTPGMRWGIRKRRTPAGPATVAAGMTTEELQKAVSRLNLEKQYRTLEAERSALGSRKDTAIKGFLAQQGQTQLKRIAKSGLDLVVEAALTKTLDQLGPKDLGKELARVRTKKK